jgi:hypothetical protein
VGKPLRIGLVSLNALLGSGVPRAGSDGSGGQLRRLTAHTVLPIRKRIPDLKLDHPRQLALMHAQQASASCEDVQFLRAAIL